MHAINYLVGVFILLLIAIHCVHQNICKKKFNATLSHSMQLRFNVHYPHYPHTQSCRDRQHDRNKVTMNSTLL